MTAFLCLPELSATLPLSTHPEDNHLRTQSIVHERVPGRWGTWGREFKSPHSGQ
jgi:hypothetical protein